MGEREKTGGADATSMGLKATVGRERAETVYWWGAENRMGSRWDRAAGSEERGMLFWENGSGAMVVKGGGPWG